MTEQQMKIADYLITKFRKTGYKYKIVSDDTIVVYHDDDTITTYRYIDGNIQKLTESIK